MSQKVSTRASSRGTKETLRSCRPCEASSVAHYVPAKRYNSVKHRKVLARGKQIKTHLLCQHIGSKPIWGAGTFAEETESQLIHEQKVNRQRMIDQKIDSLCLTEHKTKSPLRCTLKKNVNLLKSVPLKHKKVLSGGQQLKTHLICKHLKQSPDLEGQKRSYTVQGVGSSDYESWSDGGSAPYKSVLMSRRPVLKRQSNLVSNNERNICAAVNSPDDVSIVNVRVPSITSVSHQQSSNQTNPSLSFGCCNSNSKCTRKRLRFANEESANFDSSQNNASNFLQNTSSEDDLNRNGSSIGRCCRLCGKNFESLQWHPNHDSDLCHFSGSPSNVGGSGRCKYCLCCNSNGRCWAVQAFENCNSDSNIGMAQCMHCTDQGKYKNKSYINPNSLSRNNSEYSPPSSAALLKSSPKNQAKRINQLHPAPKTFDHQCVHQYHQNSRLFLEPTFPDESGCSTCQLCGLPAHDGCSSCASVSDDPDGYERGPLRKQKVSFDVPRRSTMNRSSASAPLSTSIDETETRGRNLLVSEHNPSVSLESDVVCGRYMQPRKFSESKTDPVHVSKLPSSNTNCSSRSRLLDRTSTLKMSTSRPASESMRHGRDPLFMLSVDPLLNSARTYERVSEGTTVTSRRRDFNSAKMPRGKRDYICSSSQVAKRNPAHSMALEDHI